ncbi:MAG TPA: lipid-A-disaccharide synthase [Firmicutes bacterium]|nr:lipid-A-disaccharide synthase [Bacillota bacterium]
MKYFFSAGEYSGDLNASSLIRELRDQDPTAQIWGMGGPLMAAAGAEILFDPTAESTIGFWEAARKYFIFKRYLNEFTSFLKENRPDVVVWVDFGGFNVLLAERAAALSIPVVCVFPPSAWAYGKGRARRLARCVTHLASVLPYEADFYRGFNVKVTYVGHPLVDRVKPRQKPEEWRATNGVSPEEKVILLMPGSRKQEVQTLLPIMLAAAAEVAAEQEGLRFMLPVAPTIEVGLIRSILASYPGLSVETKDRTETYDLMAVADLGLLASGTAALEAALLELPIIVTYRVAKVSAFLYQALMNKERRNQPLMVSLPNFIKGRIVVPELLQDELTPTRLAAEIRSFLTKPERMKTVRQELHGIGEILGPPGVMARVATIVREEAARKSTAPSK